MKVYLITLEDEKFHLKRKLDYLPRVGDVIVYHQKTYIVEEVEFDLDYGEINLQVSEQ